jgi:hypothetical protein
LYLGDSKNKVLESFVQKIVTQLLMSPIASFEMINHEPMLICLKEETNVHKINTSHKGQKMKNITPTIYILQL